MVTDAKKRKNQKKKLKNKQKRASLVSGSTSDEPITQDKPLSQSISAPESVEKAHSTSHVSSTSIDSQLDEGSEELLDNKVSHNEHSVLVASNQLLKDASFEENPIAHKNMILPEEHIVPEVPETTVEKPSVPPFEEEMKDAEIQESTPSQIEQEVTAIPESYPKADAEEPEDQSEVQHGPVDPEAQTEAQYSPHEPVAEQMEDPEVQEIVAEPEVETEVRYSPEEPVAEQVAEPEVQHAPVDPEAHFESQYSSTEPKVHEPVSEAATEVNAQPETQYFSKESMTESIQKDTESSLNENIVELSQETPGASNVNTSVLAVQNSEHVTTVADSHIEDLFGNNDAHEGSDFFVAIGTNPTPAPTTQDSLATNSEPGVSVPSKAFTEHSKLVNDAKNEVSELFSSSSDNNVDDSWLNQTEQQKPQGQDNSSGNSINNEKLTSPQTSTVRPNIDAIFDDDSDLLPSDDDAHLEEVLKPELNSSVGQNEDDVQDDQETSIHNDKIAGDELFNNDNDLLDDEDSLLDSDENESINLSSIEKKSEKNRNYVPSVTSSSTSHVNPHQYQPHGNPYEPKIGLGANMQQQGVPISQSSSYAYPANPASVPVVPGVVKPKLINNFDTPNASNHNVLDLQKKLDEAKHKTDAYDFPLDLVKQDIKRGKPVRVTSPIFSSKQTSFPSSASQKSSVLPPVRTLSTNHNSPKPQKPFYAELPINEIKPTRAAPVRVASQNNYAPTLLSKASSSSVLSVPGHQRINSAEPPVNPYAPKLQSEPVNSQVAPNIGQHGMGNVTVPNSFGTVRSPYGNNPEQQSETIPPSGRGPINPYAPVSNNVPVSTVKSTPYSPSQPMKSSTRNNLSISSTGSFKGKPSLTVPIPLPGESSTYNFPATSVTNGPSQGISNISTNVPAVLSPNSASSVNSTRRTHARSNSSIYAPANHAHSSKYAPTVQPQFQQQQQQYQNHPQLSHQQQQQQPSLPSGGAVLAPNLPIHGLTSYPQPDITTIKPPHMNTVTTNEITNNAPRHVDNSYIMRRQFPIFHWGKSSKIVSALPTSQGYMSGVELKIESINILTHDSVISLDKTLEQYPGPLIRGKSKVKDIVKWIEIYLEESKNRGASDLIVLLEILKLRLEPNYSFKNVNNVLYDSSVLLPYLSQPFTSRISEPNAYKLDNASLVRILTLLQTGAHDDALKLSLDLKDYAMSLLLGSILGKDKWSSVVDQYLTQEFEEGSDNDISSIYLLGTIFQVFIGNSKKVIDSFRTSPQKMEWASNNWRLLLSCVLNNVDEVSSNGPLSPLVVEFLLQYGEFLVGRQLLIPASIAFILADIPMSEEPLIPGSTITFEAIGSANAFESLMLSEIYEFSYKQKDSSFSGFTSLATQKIIHAAALSDYGLNALATKYLDTVQGLLKLLPKNTEASLNILRFIEDISNQLSSNSIGWLGKPKLSSVWGQLDKSFNKFIGGDTDIDEQEAIGVEEKVFEKFTPTTSRNPSMVDLSQSAAYFTPALNRSHISQPHSTTNSAMKAPLKKNSSSIMPSRDLSSKYGPPETRHLISYKGETHGHVSNPDSSYGNPSMPGLNKPVQFESPYGTRNPQIHQHESPYHPRMNSSSDSHLPLLTQPTFPISKHAHSNSNSSASSYKEQLHPVKPPLHRVSSSNIQSTVKQTYPAKNQTSNSSKALPLESLFDETVTTNSTDDSARTSVVAPSQSYEEHNQLPVDEVVEEIEHEIDAELDELQHSEFSDDNISRNMEQNVGSDFRPDFESISNAPPVLTSHKNGEEQSQTEATSSTSLKNGHSRQSSIPKVEPLNPYAPKAKESSFSGVAKRSKNPYAPSSVSHTGSSVSNIRNRSPHVADTSPPVESSPRWTNSENTPDNYNPPNRAAYENVNNRESDIVWENKLKDSSSRAFTPPIAESRENSMLVTVLPPHLQENSSELPLSEIKDPVIRPVKSSSVTPLIVDDEDNEEYYDDVVEDTDDDDEEQISISSIKKEMSDNRIKENQKQQQQQQQQKDIDEVEPLSDEEDTKKADDKKKQHQASSGWLGWFKKDPNEKKPIKAKLGHKNNFYYDEKLKRWINKDATEEEKVKVATPPPPPPIVKRKISQTPEIKPRQGSVVGGPALRTAHAVMPTNPLTGKPLDPIKDLTDTVKPEQNSPPSSPPPTLMNSTVKLSGTKANGLDDLMALAGGPNSGQSTRRKKRSTRGYVNVMEKL
ncbi:vesicle coat component [Kluyveromyces marxianus]|nr:vesicle coat component [Kluyveromyces marxianus]KAG0683049.1 vesicle coat component [Kluyveromyces marxianus]